MANFTRAKSGGWADEDTLTHDEANQIDEILPKVPNFAEGSTHTPAAPIAIDGPHGLHVAKFSCRGIDPVVSPLLRWRYRALTSPEGAAGAVWAANAMRWVVPRANTSDQLTRITQSLEAAISGTHGAAAAPQGVVYEPDHGVTIVQAAGAGNVRASTNGFLTAGTGHTAGSQLGSALPISGSRVLFAVGTPLNIAVSTGASPFAIAGTTGTGVSIASPQLAVGGGRVVAVGHASGVGVAAYADESDDFTDGNIWTSATITGAGTLVSVAYCPHHSRFLAISATELFTSVNGETWTKLGTWGASALESVACAGDAGVWLVTGTRTIDGGTEAFAAFSTDAGTTWRQVELKPTSGAMTPVQAVYGDGRFVVVGSGHFFASDRFYLDPDSTVFGD